MGKGMLLQWGELPCLDKVNSDIILKSEKNQNVSCYLEINR